MFLAAIFPYTRTNLLHQSNKTGSQDHIFRVTTILFSMICKGFVPSIWQTNKMQSDTADFTQVQPLDQLDETYASSLILAYSLHYVKT